jgi:hypothetical protein
VKQAIYDSILPSSFPIPRAATSTSKLVELAQTISRETEKLDRHIEENDLPEPSFDVDAPLIFPKVSGELKKAREEVMRATKELRGLVAGPTESVRWMAWDASSPFLSSSRTDADDSKHNNSLSLHAIYHYKIAQLVSLDTPVSFAQIALSTGLSELNIRRLLRHAMTNQIFYEPSPGFIAHNALSRVLATDPEMNDWVGFCIEDMWPAASKTVAALKEYPEANEPTQTGFCIANGTVGVEPMFKTFEKDGRAKRMSGAMASLMGGEGYEPSYLIENYDWASLDAKGATIVDVGGSCGHVSIALAQHFKTLKFVVQDLPKAIAGMLNLPEDVKDRITFQAHDFFTPQPTKGADVYLFRWIMHNYPDKYATLILHSLIPALKRGSRILINDNCLPEVGKETEMGMGEERVLRTMDLVMLTLLNAQERTEEDFKRLFGSVDGRFRFLGVKRPRGCRMSILEAVWEGEDFGGVRE